MGGSAGGSGERKGLAALLPKGGEPKEEHKTRAHACPFFYAPLLALGLASLIPKRGEPIEYIGKNRAMHCPFYYALRSLGSKDPDSLMA